MGTKLPRKLEQKMQIVGEQIRLARLRRNLSIAQIAERATCSPLTVSRIEKGAPTVAIGIYLRMAAKHDFLQSQYDSFHCHRLFLPELPSCIVLILWLPQIFS